MFGSDEIYLSSNSLPLLARMLVALRRWWHVVRTGHEISTVEMDGLKMTYCSSCARDRRITVLGMKTLTSRKK